MGYEESKLMISGILAFVGIFDGGIKWVEVMKAHNDGNNRATEAVVI